jgi:hypothetical protein
VLDVGVLAVLACLFQHGVDAAVVESFPQARLVLFEERLALVRLGVATEELYIIPLEF